MATTWVVTAASQRATLADGRAEIAFTVTNPGTAPDRVMFAVVPGGGAAPGWFSVDEPQRPVGAGSSTSYVVHVNVPGGTAPGSYDMQARVYSADSAPEETSVLSQRVGFEVAPSAAVPVPPKPFPKWIFAVIAALVVIVGLVLWLVLKPDDEESGKDTTSTTVKKESVEFGVPHLLSPREGDQIPADQEVLLFKWESAGSDVERYEITIDFYCDDGGSCRGPIESLRLQSTSHELEIEDSMRGNRIRWSVVAVRDPNARSTATTQPASSDVVPTTTGLDPNELRSERWFVYLLRPDEEPTTTTLAGP